MEKRGAKVSKGCLEAARARTEEERAKKGAKVSTQHMAAYGASVAATLSALGLDQVILEAKRYC